MKLLVFYIFTILMYVSSAFAYIDVSEVNDAKSSAGTQNTNLYKLNSINKMQIKNLHKIDKAIRSNPELNYSFNSEELQEIISDNTQGDETDQVALKKVLENVIKRTSNPKILKADITDNYKNIIKASANSVKDRETIISLKEQLRRYR